jgi:ribose transport system substrate-binding protein
VVQQVNVLLISPKESAGLTGVVEKAIDARIPVIVLDRNVDTKRIAQFIGGDNVAIGRAAGEHAVKLLGGAGKAKGNVVEIWGGMGTSPRTIGTTASTPTRTRSLASNICLTISRVTGSRIRPTTS